MPRRKRKTPEPDRGACVIYARFSSDKQRDESIEDQVRVCSDWAAGHGLTVVATYEDRALSATSDARPEFRRMVENARSGNFGTVLVYKLDRFARDRFDAAVYRKRLAECGVSLQSAMEAIPEGPEGVILESVIDGFNEYYSKNLSQNTLRGMLGNAERCLANGVTVYGYRITPEQAYEVDEGQARFVRGAFERAAGGWSRKEIVSWLNAEGSRTVRGSLWGYCSVARLLTNEKYRGVYVFDSVRVEGGMPRIVGDDLWHAAQPTQARKPRQWAYPLSGKLYDARTGTPYRGTNGTSSTGRVYLYYSMPLGDGHERRYRRADVEEAVTRALSEAFADRELSGQIARAARLVIEAGGETAALRAARQRISEIDRSQANLLRALEAGIVADGMAERIAALREERATLERRVAELDAPAPTEEELARWIRTRLCKSRPEELLAHAVTRCEIDEGGRITVEIPWRTREEMLGKRPLGTKKDCERAGKSTFAEFIFGSPGDSDKERTNLKVTTRGIVLSRWVGTPCTREWK